jgi:hypothetical protein
MPREQVVEAANRVPGALRRIRKPEKVAVAAKAASLTLKRTRM